MQSWWSIPSSNKGFFFLSCGCCKQISLFGSYHNERWNLVVFHSAFLVYSPMLKTFSPSIMNSTSHYCQPPSQNSSRSHQIPSFHLQKARHTKLRHHNKAEPGYLSFHKHPFLLIVATIWQQDCYKYMNKNHKYTTQHDDNGLSNCRNISVSWLHDNIKYPSSLRRLRAVPWLMWSVTNPSTQKPGFNPRPVHVGSVLDQVAVVGFSPSTLAVPCWCHSTSYTHIHPSIPHKCYITLATDSTVT